MTEDWIARIVTAAVIGLMLYFMKKLFDKVDSNEKRVGKVESEAAVRDERIVRIYEKIEDNSKLDDERWKKVEQMWSEMREIRSKNNESLAKIEKQITKQNSVMIIIAQKLDVGDTVKHIYEQE